MLPVAVLAAAHLAAANRWTDDGIIDGLRDIEEIAKRLKVSRARVSTNSLLLQSLAIAQLVTEPGNRRDYLQIRGDPCSSLPGLGLQRMQSMRVAIREMRLAISGAQFNATRGRLQGMEKFYDMAIAQVQAALGGCRERDPEPTPVMTFNIRSRRESVAKIGRVEKRRAARP